MRPLIREFLIVLNTFLRDNSLPMSPYLPRYIHTIARLEGERHE